MSFQPVILHASQFPLPVYTRVECDCACASGSFTLHSPQTANAQTPLRTTPVIRQTLPHHYELLFNPQHTSGIAALNPTAQALWMSFNQPTGLRLADLPSTARSVAEDFLKLGLVSPVAESPTIYYQPPSVLSVWLHITNACNLRCDYCYINKSDEAMSLATGHAAIDAAIRSALKHNFQLLKLKFAGGEASLNLKLVFALHTYAIQRARDVGLGLECVVLSNGVALGLQAIEEFERRGLRVMISLDGLGAAHDLQRPFANGQGSFAWVQRSLDRLAARHIRPFISITLSGRNAAQLPEVVRYVLERQLPFNINFFRDNDCAAPFADLRLHDAEMIAALLAAFQVIEQNLPDASLLGALVDRSQFDQPHNKTCSVGEAYLVIDHHGRIAKCQMEIEQTITEVFADDPLAILQSSPHGIQNLSVDEKEGCRDCEWKYWCTGGCPALTFRATGRYDVKSPNCYIYKAIYPALLRLEGLRLMKLAGLPLT